jgi:HEAT repeat protein
MTSAHQDTGRIGLFTTDVRLVIATWDPALERLTGIRAEDARGRRLDEIVPGLSSRPIFELIREPLISGSAQVLAPALHKFLIPCPPLEPSVEFDQMQQRVVVGALRNDEAIEGLVITIEDVTARLEDERRLARKLRDGLGDVGATLAAEDWRARRSAVRSLAAMRDAALVDSLVAALREGHRDFNLLSSALQLLTLTGVDMTEALVGLLGDPDADLRIQAALALGTQRDARAVSALLASLRDVDTNVRFHAIEALGKLAPPEAIVPLVEIVDSRDFFLAFPAIEALVRINDPIVSSRLAPLLSDATLSSAAADALGQIGDEDAVVPIIDALNAGTVDVQPLVDALASIHRRYLSLFSNAGEIEDLVRHRISPVAVSRMLDRLGRASGDSLRSLITVLRWLRDRSIPAALARLIGSGDVQHEIVEALVRFGSSAVDLLTEQLTSGDTESRRLAVIALGRIGDQQAVPALLPLLEEDDPRLTVPVAVALARLGDSRAFEPLLGLLGDRDASVRQAAIGALNSIGHSDMARRVSMLLKDKDARVRESATRIAGYFGYPECLEALVACATDTDEAVRVAALESLPYFDSQNAIELLADALANGTPRVRGASAQALGSIGGAAARTLLERSLQDPEAWVRYFSAVSLGRHRDESALAALHRTAAGDAVPHVRVAAIDAIGLIGGASAPQLLEPFTEIDGDVGHAAIRALSRRCPPSMLPIFERALRSPDPLRRKVAVEGLAAQGIEAAIEPLQWTAAADADAAVAGAAFQALASISNMNVPASRRAVDAVIGTLSDPSRRAHALSTLARLAPPAIPWLAEGLRADDPLMRRGCVEALGRLSHPVASAYLQRALHDSDAHVRRQAVGALSRIGTRGISKTLSAMARTDASPLVRDAALAALNRQQTEGSEPGA